MNAKEARAEAIRRWGRFGAAQCDQYTGACRVGVINRELGLDCYGSGETWEKAFTKAEGAGWHAK